MEGEEGGGEVVGEIGRVWCFERFRVDGGGGCCFFSFSPFVYLCILCSGLLYTWRLEM